MSNKTAAAKITIAYTGPSEETTSIPQLTISAPYQAQSHGTLDVPDAEASATAHAIPFGSIGADCTCALLVNRTKNGANPGQDLILKVNGSAALQRIPPGGSILIANPVAAGGSPVTALSLTTTDIQAGPGEIEYHLFGDPV